MESISKYKKYKSSDIEGIGDIPEHWKIKRLKNVLEEKLMYGANEIGDEDDESNPRYIRITDFGDNGELRNDTFRSLTYKIAKDYLLKEGDILFARSGATVGKTFQFRNYKGTACFAGYLIKASPNLNIITSDYLFFFTQCNAYENWKNSIFNKATIENIGADKYQFLKLTLPSLEEQFAIANFLNEQIQKIDHLIANKKAQTEKLKELRQIEINNAVTKGLNPNVELKESGIDWLGKIPKHWEVKRLKDFSSMSSGNTITSDFIDEEGDYPVYGGNGLRGYYHSYTHEGNFVLIGRQGALCGNINYAEGKFWASEHAVVVSLKKKFSHYWLGELLRTMNLNQYSQASAQPGLSVEKIIFLKVAVPPIEEQIQIGDYLQQRIESIDKIMLNIEMQIEKLQELRKIKIYEAVTGKIKVEAYAEATA